MVFVLGKNKMKCFFWIFQNVVFFDGKFQNLCKMEKKLCGFCVLEKKLCGFCFLEKKLCGFFIWNQRFFDGFSKFFRTFAKNALGNVHIIRNSFGGRGGLVICYEALWEDRDLYGFLLRRGNPENRVTYYVNVPILSFSSMASQSPVAFEKNPNEKSTSFDYTRTKML
jgi:hypothetical protein